MMGGPDLASAPLVRAVLARWSWRPVAARGTQSLLGRLAAHGAPMVERSRALQAWHDGLALRWRPVDMMPPALTGGGGGPVSAAGMTGPPAAVGGTAPARGSPEPGGGWMRNARGRAAPVLANPVSGAESQAQRLPAAAPAPLRPALAITALAAPSAAPPPVPFRSSTPTAAAAADPARGAVLVPAIGRRFARREVAGGFREAPSRGPAGDGAITAARPMAMLVRWRAADDRPSDDASWRAGARLPASDLDAHLDLPSDLPVLWAEPPLPAQRTGPTPGRAAPGADLVDRLGAPEASAPSALSLRLVRPDEAARRLAQRDGVQARDEAAGARSTAGDRRGFPPSAARTAIDIDVIVERVQRELKRRERFERERKGLL
jgi:hypothetical protein